MHERLAEPCDLAPLHLGESCRFDEVSGELLFVDVFAGDFYRARPEGRTLAVRERIHLDGHLTALAPVAGDGGGWIVALTRALCYLAPDGTLSELAGPEHHNAPHVRLNDGACDSAGRFWIGSMAYDARPGAGSLYRFSEDTGIEKVRDGVTISNGIGWSGDDRTMFYVDSGAATIEAFAFDAGRGTLGERRLVAQLDAAREGVPDGLCIDAEDNLWVAIWGGHEVRRYSPAGELLERVRVPVAQPASCALGGANGTTLYITTARDGRSPDELAAEPDSGRLFCCDVGVAGRPLNRFVRR